MADYIVNLLSGILPASISCGWVQLAVAVPVLLVYRRLRINRWRDILKSSIEYHKYHLYSLSRGSSNDSKSRELAQSLLWCVTKQLPDELKNGRGGAALLNSMAGNKTSINTCGTVFYECAKNYQTIEPVIYKLNITLISTLYRIFIIESPLSVIGILHNDLLLIIHFLKRTNSGSGRLYLDLNSDLCKKTNNLL